MKKTLYLVLILFILSTWFWGCSKKIDDNINETSTNIQQTNELSKNIEGLINKSLNIQYGTSEIELSQVFSSKFISKIQDTLNFYKKELKPYKIVSINLDGLKNGLADNFVVYVRVSDSKGEYTQVVHIIKKDGIYVIEDIEYDI